MPDTITALAVTRLQALHATLKPSALKYVPASLAVYPTQLNTNSLPAALAWPAGEAQSYHKGGGWGYAVVQMTALLFIAPLGQNDIPANAAEAVRVYDAMRALYITSSNIPLAEPGDNTGGYQITLESGPTAQHGDGGIEPNLSFGGAAFYGARFRLNVTLQWVPGS